MTGHFYSQAEYEYWYAELTGDYDLLDKHADEHENLTLRTPTQVFRPPQVEDYIPPD